MPINPNGQISFELEPGDYVRAFGQRGKSGGVLTGEFLGWASQYGGVCKARVLFRFVGDTLGDMKSMERLVHPDMLRQARQPRSRQES